MRRVCYTFMTCATLVVAENAPCADSTGPGSLPVYQARVAWTLNVKERCPELRIADDGTLAVVVFQVNDAGAPSQASIKTSSGSADLDAAALRCVARLRFNPATRVGDGVPVSSWQQMAWRWALPAAGTAAGTPAAVPPSAPPAVPAAGVATAAPASAPSDHRVELRACATESGKLLQEPAVTRSSGDAALDQAAIRIARSGADALHPASTSGCVQMAIKFEVR